MKKMVLIVTLFISFNLFGWSDADYDKYDYKSFQGYALANERIDMKKVDYALLNAAVFYETNRQRVLNGRSEFAHSPALENAAWNHSKDMADYKFFSHTSVVKGKKTFTDRLKLVGISNTASGENILETFGIEYKAGTSLSPKGKGVFYYGSKRIENHTYLGLAKVFLDMWMNSPGHKANILNANFKYLGCGAYHFIKTEFYDMDQFKGTQKFAAIKGPQGDKKQESEVKAEEKKELGAEKLIMYGRLTCSRCNYMKKKLKEKNIAYEFVDIDLSAQNKQLMWKKVREHDPETRSVGFPVMEYKGKIYVNPTPEDMFALVVKE
jgi:uncharacterized protein YkwD/glutaredoxin